MKRGAPASSCVAARLRLASSAARRDAASRCRRSVVRAARALTGCSGRGGAGSPEKMPSNWRFSARSSSGGVLGTGTSSTAVARALAAVQGRGRLGTGGFLRRGSLRPRVARRRLGSCPRARDRRLALNHNCRSRGRGGPLRAFGDAVGWPRGGPNDPAAPCCAPFCHSTGSPDRHCCVSYQDVTMAESFWLLVGIYTINIAATAQQMSLAAPRALTQDGNLARPRNDVPPPPAPSLPLRRIHENVAARPARH